MNTSALKPKTLAVGVDVGGTFTDLFVLDESTGRASIVKVPSTRGAEAQGFMNGLARIDIGLPEGAEAIGQIANIVHGTTVGTNALLERKTARTGLITTRGFSDVLEMRRRDRPQTWGLRGAFTPLVPRDLRREVDERVLADGSVHTAVNLAQVKAQAKALLDLGCEAVCVFFINAYANRDNEDAAVAAVRTIWPNDHVTGACEILPEIREFERCSTAVVNATLRPIVGDYLERLATALTAQNFTGNLLVVQSNGGVMSRASACELPALTALSGPAAGVIACAAIAQATGFPNVITGDMGGTSFDVSLVNNGEAALTEQTAIEFGIVIRTPMVKIETIGAGGGSIATVDASGMLAVGPESAGSVPGPACYDRGNERPTVTDANVVLGRICASRPIGGGLLKPLNQGLAEAAIQTYVAKPLGLTVLEAAEAILTVANARMAGAVRLVSIERGHDPRLFAYMPFGGGGALHVCAMMREVGVTTSIVPRYPGVTSALGCVLADMRHDLVQTLNCTLDELDVGALQHRIATLSISCEERLNAAGVKFQSIRQVVALDMLYAGQTHSLPVKFTMRQMLSLTKQSIRGAFEEAYLNAFGRVLPGLGVRVLNLRYAKIGVRPKFDLSALAPAKDCVLTPVGSQQVFHQTAWLEATRYSRLDMPVGARINGPAILEQLDATIWLEPGFTGVIDALGNFVICLQS
jgi:N-methylhydantoinase A